MTPGERIDQAIREGDSETVLRIGLHARFEADKGNFCQCPEPEHSHPEDARPILGEVGLMCNRCGLDDLELRERVEEYMQSHPFELPPESGLRRDDIIRRMGWCRVCTRPEEDPRHRTEALA